MTRIKLGDLEKLLWQYAYGPPAQHPVSVMDEMFETLLDFGSTAE
jgi:hypothetical protein